MKTTNKNRIKFFIFLGSTFFFYVVLFFPLNSDEVLIRHVLFDILRSIIFGFISTYFSWWGVNFIDRKLLGKEKDNKE